MKAKISIITLGVSDFEKSLSFYRDGLKFPVDNMQDDIVFFDMQGTCLALYPRKKLAQDADISSDSTGFPGFTLAHNESSKGAVDETYSAAIAAGAKEVKKPKDVFWGGYSGYFADPDGYLWEIAWNPFTDRT